MSVLRHPNIVLFIGFCCREAQMEYTIISEYMSQGESGGPGYWSHLALGAPRCCPHLLAPLPGSDGEGNSSSVASRTTLFPI